MGVGRDNLCCHGFPPFTFALRSLDQLDGGAISLAFHKVNELDLPVLQAWARLLVHQAYAVGFHRLHRRLQTLHLAAHVHQPFPFLVELFHERTARINRRDQGDEHISDVEVGEIYPLDLHAVLYLHAKNPRVLCNRLIHVTDQEINVVNTLQHRTSPFSPVKTFFCGSADASSPKSMLRSGWTPSQSNAPSRARAAAT